MNRNPGWWFSIPLALACASAAGADADGPADFSNYFQHDRYEVSLMSGAMFSPVGADRNRRTEDYTLSGLRFEWMLTDASGERWWRGNWEAGLEAFGGAVYDGIGNYIAGGAAWVRYNFVPPNSRVVPYVGFGAGAEETDMDRHLIGQRFNFNLQVASGIRYFVAPNWSINLECRYQHISNATINKHDVGINAVGPMLGVSYLY